MPLEYGVLAKTSVPLSDDSIFGLQGVLPQRVVVEHVVALLSCQPQNSTHLIGGERGGLSYPLLPELLADCSTVSKPERMSFPRALSN